MQRFGGSRPSADSRGRTAPRFSFPGRNDGADVAFRYDEVVEPNRRGFEVDLRVGMFLEVISIDFGGSFLGIDVVEEPNFVDIYRGIGAPAYAFEGCAFFVVEAENFAHPVAFDAAGGEAAFEFSIDPESLLAIGFFRGGIHFHHEFNALPFVARDDGGVFWFEVVSIKTGASAIGILPGAHFRPVGIEMPDVRRRIGDGRVSVVRRALRL